jgi:hypothetical protein
MVFSDGKVSLRRWCFEWTAFFGLCALVVFGIHLVAADASRSAAKREDDLLYRIGVMNALAVTSESPERVYVQHPSDPDRGTVVVHGRIAIETYSH